MDSSVWVCSTKAHRIHMYVCACVLISCLLQTEYKVQEATLSVLFWLCPQHWHTGSAQQFCRVTLSGWRLSARRCLCCLSSCSEWGAPTWGRDAEAGSQCLPLLSSLLTPPFLLRHLAPFWPPGLRCLSCYPTLLPMMRLFVCFSSPFFHLSFQGN